MNLPTGINPKEITQSFVVELNRNLQSLREISKSYKEKLYAQASLLSPRAAIHLKN